MTDLLIVGAGPAGLLAGYIAARKGLKVTIVEMKRDITTVNRACSAQLVLDEGYEGETLRVEEGNLVFTKNGFKVPYRGKLVPILHNYMISPKGHRVAFEKEDLSPMAIHFDKQELLRGLLELCVSAGVEIRDNTMALRGRDNGGSVVLVMRGEHGQYEMEAKKLIIAEGVNRRLTETFGLNKGYQCMGIPLTREYTLEGTTGIPHNSWIQYYGNAYHPFFEIMVGESTESDDALEFTVMGMGEQKPAAFFEKLVQDSPLTPNLRNARIIHRKGCSCCNYLSLSKPYNGNVLAIGDSAAHIETINQGALMCGYHAGNAVAEEMEGKNGFEAYTKWWNGAFEFNCEDKMEQLKVMGALNIMKTLADDEIDYVFSLLENEKHCGHFNQFEVPKNFWTDVLKHDEEIRKDRPSLYEKMKDIRMYKEQGKY